MDKIILCFDLNNHQTDFSNFMQIIQAFEGKGQENSFDYVKILKKISIRYCLIKETDMFESFNWQIINNIEKQWNKSSLGTKNTWDAHNLTELDKMIAERKKYKICYYVRIKNALKYIKNIQYLLLVMQQLPSLHNRIGVFIEPFEHYISANKRSWLKESAYQKYSHFMRFILGRYNNVFYSAFFDNNDNIAKVRALSSKKTGIQSTFFPLIEVDSDMYAVLSIYCALDAAGMPAEYGEENIDSKLEDLLEISKKILDKRIEEQTKYKVKMRKAISSNIYKVLSKDKIKALEYAVFSVIVPVSENLRETDIDNCRKRAVSISNGLSQIIENIFMHSYNHKGVFAFRIIEDGQEYFATMFKGRPNKDLDRVLEIDIADANSYETILDNFSRKLEDKDKYFSGIKLSVSHFLRIFHDENEREAWTRYRVENPIRCMGLERLAQDLKLCKAVLKLRSSTNYQENDSKLVCWKNYFDSSEFSDALAEEYIPGAQFQILVPIFNNDEEAKQHNANIFLNGIGNFVENDKDYAGFVEYEAKALIDCSISELAGCLCTAAMQEQEDDAKNHAVCKWKEEINKLSVNIDPDKKAVYFINMSGLTEMNPPWGIEAFCKGIVDSDIFYQGKVRYIAMINCNIGFIKMMFDTIMMSKKVLSGGLQIYLHTVGGLEDIVISGSNAQDIVRNARQYCYLREKPLAFIDNYWDEYEGSFIYENIQELFPFDVILSSNENDETTLFEQYIGNVAQCPLTSIDEAGYWLNDIHMRLGNKVHLKEFYEISILFRKTRIARKIALLVIRRMIKEGIGICDNFLFYGYASYSREILTALSEIVKMYQQGKEHNEYFVGFSVYQNDIMVQKTLSHISAKVKMYFDKDVPEDIEVKIVQVVPIISTLTTFKKMWDMFLENNSGKKTKKQLVKNYTLFWVRDLQKDGRFEKPTEIEGEYWAKIAKNRTVETELISPGPQFFCYKAIKWYNPLNCEQCYPENVLDEFALVETDVTSTVPSQQLEVELPSQAAEGDDRNRIINEIRIVNLKDCIFYGHIYRDGNHFQYYVDTTQYFHRQKKYIEQWLNNLSQYNKEKNALNIIVSPQHHTNVEFGHYVSNYYFHGNADVIVIDSTKEYRSNIIAKYADVKAAIKNAIESQTKVRFTYVDDTIISGSTYRRVNNLLHSLAPKEIQKPIQFDYVFVLVNRMSFHSKMDYVDDVGKNFHAYVDINVSSVRNFGDSCAMCTLQKNARLFFKRSSTKEVSQYWDEKQHDYKAVAFDKYPQLEDFEQRKEQGYFRLLCSHYAKEHLLADEDYKQGLLGIVKLMSDIIAARQRVLKAGNVEAIEESPNIVHFESEKLSPIYCCVFGRNALEAIKAYLKVLCRPFFSYGKIYRQIILDFLLLLSESFLKDGFVEKLEDKNCEISSSKSYFNDVELRGKITELCKFLKENMPKPEDRINFVQEYLLEGLTDLRSNYIIRKSTIDNYKNMFSDTVGHYDEYYKYEKMIHRLVNSSADETKSLWMEYLLITGTENAGDMNKLNKIGTCGVNGEDDFCLFWKSLIIENTRLYYDSMLFFVRKASDFIENDKRDVEEAICEAVEALWGDYYIKNLRRFIRLEMLAESRSGSEIENEMRERVIKTASLLYLLKKEASNGIERYAELKKRILDLLYDGDELLILTSAFAGAQNDDELYAVTDYKRKSVSAKVSLRVKEAIKHGNLQNKSYYLGENYIVLCVDNNEGHLRSRKIEDLKYVKIQPLYFYIECNTDNHLLVVFRIRKILMYRHQLLRWIEADFNNNAMPILAEQMGIYRQLSRERAGDHNTNTDILTIEKLLQSEYKKSYQDIYQLLLLKAYVNMRIARLFRSEWGEVNDKAYTLEQNEDKMNKAMRNLGYSVFGETLEKLSPRQYLALVEEIFRFDVEIYGETLKDAKISELEAVLGKLKGRCENGFYYKQEYIICIIFDILFTAVKFCRNWDIDIHKFFRQPEHKNADVTYEDNVAIAQYYILKHDTEKCRLTIKTEDIPQTDAAYLVFKNVIYGVSKENVEQKNKEFVEKMEVKETAGMSLQAMKWYTESLGDRDDIKAAFLYEWNEEQKVVEFVIKLPILSKERI